MAELCDCTRRRSYTTISYLSNPLSDNNMLLSNLKYVSKYSIQFISVLTATLVILSEGLQFGWASPAIPRLLQNDSSIIITRGESKWITQSYIMGNIAGVIMSVCIFRNMSRKLSIYVASLPVLLGWIGNLLAPSLTVLSLARFIGGVGRNMAFVALPIYIGEIADPKIRGTLGSFMYLSMNIGVLIVFAITPIFSLCIPGIIGISIIGLQMVLLKFIPESPYYLLLKHKKDEARIALKTLRKSNGVEEELIEMSAAIQRQTEGSNNNFGQQLHRLFTKKSNLKAMGILLMLRSLQMFSGISVMTMHIHSIFAQAGGNFSPECASIIYAVILLASCLFSATTADRFGRKTLMVFSCSSTALILLSQGTYFFLKLHCDYNMSSVSWLPIFNTVVFVLVYRVGLGTVPIIMISEVFPADVKVAGVVLADLMYSVSSLASNMVFEFTEDKLGMYTPFWIFAGCCILGAALSLIVIPETRGKSLEEIQYLLIHKTYKKDIITNAKTFHPK